MVCRHSFTFRQVHGSQRKRFGRVDTNAPAMPTLGKLLGRSKTKEEKEQKNASAHSNYQPVQYKSTTTTSQPKAPTADPSKAGPASPSANAAKAPVTGTPDPATRVPTNGEPQQTDMNVANLVNPATGAVESKNQPRQVKGKYTLTDFKIERTLGTGSFGRVHLVQSKHNQRYYAIKVLKKAQVVKMKQIEHTNDERRMLQRVKHPFLITLWGTFQDSRNLYMVMDFIEGGELFSLLRKSQVSLQRTQNDQQLTLSAFPQPSRKILRSRSDSCSRIPTCTEHYLS